VFSIGLVEACEPLELNEMVTLLARSLKWILLGAVAIYFFDWASLSLQLARHNGMGKVTVSQYLATPLKGQKEEYDYLGQVDQPCVKSIFPHNSSQPCWWLERHKNQWQGM
jgi:hypothetical protein